eukprot:5161495-Ditylum_brightwellii.AAC.1
MAIATPEEEEEEEKEAKEKEEVKSKKERELWCHGVPIDREWVLGLGPRMVTEYTLPGSVIDFEKK